MNGKNHLKIACATGLGLAVMNGVQDTSIINLGLAIPVAGLSGLIVDLDSPKSNANKILSKLTPIALGLLGIALLIDKSTVLGMIQHPSKSMIGLFTLIAFIFLAKKAPHRTFSHRFYGTALFAVAVKLLIPTLAVYAIAGYVSHLVADSLTKRKVDFFAPIIPVAIGIPLIVVGKNVKLENFIAGSYTNITTIVSLGLLIGVI